MSGPARLGLRDAAAHLGVHYMTVYKYVRTGRLPAERRGSQWTVTVADLDRLGEPGRLAEAGPARRSRPNRLRDRMVAGDEPGAWTIVEEALASGRAASDVYTGMLVPALRSIGDGWERGRLSVADEHRASTVATRIVGRLGPRFARRGRTHGTVVLGAPEGDLHALPSAIVADLLRMRGFEAIDLGANTPARSFVETAVSADRLVAVLVGATWEGSIASLASTVEALRAAGVDAPILVGGRAVGDRQSARALGADHWSGTSGESAVAAVEAVTGS